MAGDLAELTATEVVGVSCATGEVLSLRELILVVGLEEDVSGGLIFKLLVLGVRVDINVAEEGKDAPTAVARVLQLHCLIEQLSVTGLLARLRSAACRGADDLVLHCARVAPARVVAVAALQPTRLRVVWRALVALSTGTSIVFGLACRRNPDFLDLVSVGGALVDMGNLLDCVGSGRGAALLLSLQAGHVHDIAEDLLLVPRAATASHLGVARVLGRVDR